MGIFEPFRAIGYITTSVPFSVQRLGTETFVTVSVGNAWQIYNCAKLNLVLVGPQLPKKIRALASYRDYTFAAYGSKIGVFKRAHEVATWTSHGAKINFLYLFGDHILSVDVEGNLFIWAFKGIDENLEPISHIVLDGKFTPTCIMHPDTYLNKVVLGSQEGSFQLWNVNTKKKLYDFKGWNSPISCCVSSPALDVVALGCADGKIHVHNLRFDEEVVTFTHSTRGAVTSLSFSTDGQPLLASGGTSGVISIWNLEKRRLQSVIREAHDSSIVSLHFFANEPVLMSSSADNSIKMWIFDTTDGDPRLLRFRSGHSAPPACIRFYANGRHILSAGHDRAFTLFSVVQDQQSRELSQRHVSKRAKKLRVKVWDFRRRELKSRWEVGCTLVKIVCHRPNGLVATVADDLVIRVYDVVALKMVRKFEGHIDRVTDMSFSEDGKWLLSSSMDGTLRIWDVILGRQIDALQVDIAITALSLSPNMDVLATTHVDQNGVYLWANQAMYTGSTSIDSYASGKHVVHVNMPSTSPCEKNEDASIEESKVDDMHVEETVGKPKFDQKIPDLVALSLLPKSQWQSLINLDIIKDRNKPIEPPKKPEKVPFFLTSMPSLSGDIMFKPTDKSDEELNGSGRELHSDLTNGLPASPFLQVLESAIESKNYSWRNSEASNGTAGEGKEVVRNADCSLAASR